MKRSREVKASLLVLSVAGFVAACGQKPPEQYASVAACEQDYGVGQCNVAEPVPMTKENRPSFKSKDECEREFGKGNCEGMTQPSSTNSSIPFFMWLPLFLPGRTYYYPPGSGRNGYYKSDYRATPPVSASGRSVVATPRQGATRIGGSSPRGGYGGTGSRIGGGSG